MQFPPITHHRKPRVLIKDLGKRRRGRAELFDICYSEEENVDRELKTRQGWAMLPV